MLAGCSITGYLPAPGLKIALADQAWSTISGRVLWDVEGGRSTQAVFNDQAKRATVTLIDTTNPAVPLPVSSTITDTEGRYQLQTSGSFVPGAGVVYVLEASKGIQEGLPGWDMTRLRTLINFFQGSWRGLAGDTTISSGTTAIAISWQYRVTSANPTAAAINLMTTLVEPGATFTPGSTGISQTEFTDLRNKVRNSVAFDCDPIACITFDSSSGVFNFSSSTGPQVAFTSPAAGTPGTEVTISGARFEANPTDNLVEFNGVAAQIIDGRTDFIKVRVPVGASTGPLKVTKLSGASDSKLFQVNPMMNGKFTIYN
jgi:hypothetical protein